MRVNGTGPGRSGPGPFFLGLARILPGAVLVPMLAIGFFSAQVEPACAKEASARAGVVIKYSEGDEARACVPFDASATASPSNTISGLEALQETGHEVVTKDFGGELGVAVCKIDNVGTDDCNFDAGFWVYYHGEPDGSFQFSEVGPSNYRVPDRGTEGWAWSPAGTGSAPPAKVTFDEICTQTPTEAAQSREKKQETSSPLPWIIIGLTVAALIIGTIISRRVGGGA